MKKKVKVYLHVVYDKISIHMAQDRMSMYIWLRMESISARNSIHASGMLFWLAVSRVHLD
jgi:hypothetical protein